MKEIITRILYVLAIIGFVTYLITGNSGYMFCGSVFLMAVSLIYMSCNKNKILINSTSCMDTF